MTPASIRITVRKDHLAHVLATRRRLCIGETVRVTPPAKERTHD